MAAAGAVKEGDVLAGKFRVERILGAGGMGVVVAAQHLQLDQLVAIKFMLPEVAGNAAAVERFLREARNAARLKNEHVGRVIDFGQLETGAPYIVMEYLDGRDLGAVIRERGPLPPSEVAEYVLQACEAMAEAHAQGIVHRDLKPENLFLTTRQDGRPLVKVLDFGISKSMFSTGREAQQTSTKMIMGSPSYMSPEQMRSSRGVDPRADIWSLGVILYQLVSGTLPFEADTMPELVLKLLEDEPARLESIRPDLPPNFARLVHRCLQKDREARFAHVAELAAALTPFAPLRARAALALISRVLKVPVPEAPETPEPPEMETPEVDEDPRSPPAAGGAVSVGAATTMGVSVGEVVARPAGPRRRVGLVVAVATGVAAAAVVALVATHGGTEKATVTPAASPSAPPTPTAVIDPGPPAVEPKPQVAPAPAASTEPQGLAELPPPVAEPAAAEPAPALVVEPPLPTRKAGRVRATKRHPPPLAPPKPADDDDDLGPRK